MMKLKNLWKNHLKENNMSYYQHMLFALLYSWMCLSACVFLFIHALFPCFFQTAGSDLVRMMALVFKKRDRVDDT